MADEIVNRVAQSALVTLDLEALYTPGGRVALDIRPQLYQDLILREKEFRQFVKDHDWTAYSGRHVAVFCSADAIVPTWAYMLLAVALEPFAETVVFGSLEDLEEVLFRRAMEQVDWPSFDGARVVVKGCSKVKVPVSIYVETAYRLRNRAQSIMYGEPCSTVPIFKRSKA